MNANEFPVYDWDAPGLPPRAKAERCANHRGLCAFRDDDPLRCPRCHALWTHIERRKAPTYKPEPVSHECERRYGIVPPVEVVA